MNRKGFTLVEIMVVVAIVSVISVLGILESKHARINANDMTAAQTIRSLAIALELYAVKNSGIYPMDLNDLVTADPPYFYANICDGVVRHGYFYNRSPMNGYTVEASPEVCGETGTRHLTMEAGMQYTDGSCGS